MPLVCALFWVHEIHSLLVMVCACSITIRVLDVGTPWYQILRWCYLIAMSNGLSWWQWWMWTFCWALSRLWCFILLPWIIQVASLASLAQLLPPRSPTWVIRRRTALCAELLLPVCVRFSCCSPIALIRFNCCSPFASTSAAALRLRPLQLLLHDYVRFNCSPIASASTAAPRLHSLQLLLRSPIAFACDSSPCQRSRPFPRRIRGSVNGWVRRSRVTSLVPPHEHPTSVTHRHTLESWVFYACCSCDQL